MEEQEVKLNGLQAYFKNMTIKRAAMLFTSVFVFLILTVSVFWYKKNKIESFSYRIDKANTAVELQIILDEGCPSELLPLANYSLAKAIFEEGDFQKSSEIFEKCVKRYKKHFLYGRMVIGYIHSGFENVRSPEFLIKTLDMIKSNEFIWKNEALYDIALLLEQTGEKEKASEIYREIIAVGDGGVESGSVWASQAEFKLAELKNEEK